jgi:hypothetical protein
MARATTLKAFPVLLLITAISFFAALNPPAGPPQNAPVSVNISQSTADSTSPRVGVDSVNAVYAVWVEAQSPRQVYFATNKSGTWSAPSAAGKIESSNADAGMLAFAVSPAGACHLIYQDLRPSNFDIYHRPYESSAWGTQANISANAGVSAFSTCAVNPVDNTAFVIWEDSTVEMWDLYLRFRDATGVWGQVQILPLDVGYTPSLAFDAMGTAHLVWSTRLYGNSSVWYSKNPDAQSAAQWTKPLLVKAATGEDFCYPKVACDKEGNAYIVWIDRNPGNHEIFFRKVAADTTLGPETNVSNSIGSSAEPAVAADAATGNVGIAWTENGDVFYNSYNGTWTGASNLSNIGMAASPSLVADATGAVHLVYSAVTGGNYEILYMELSIGGPPPSTTTTTSIPVKPSPPIAASIITGIDPILGSKVNTIVWYRNLDNRGLNLLGYRVYRKGASQPADAFARFVDVSADDYQYQDAGLPFGARYAYKTTALSQDGGESDGSDVLVEDALFPPANVACATVINRSLALREKINIITWRPTPLNAVDPPASYILYRKVAGQEETAYLPLATLKSSVLEYRDRKVPTGVIYDYALTAVDAARNESRRSDVARAKQ